jgi:hypothetical protein
MQLLRTFSLILKLFVSLFAQNPDRCASTQCPEEWFRCNNHRCIPPNCNYFFRNLFLILIQHFFLEGRCDGGIDCINGEDENNCDTYQQSLSETNSTSSHIFLNVSTPPTVPSNKTILKSTQTMLEPPTSSATSAYSRG